MSKRVAGAASRLAAIACLVFASWARAQALEVAAAEGEAHLQDQPVAAGAVVREGAALRTGRDGYLALRLADGATLALLPGAQARATTVRAGALVLALERGRMEILAAKPAPGAALAPVTAIEVRTALGVVQSRGGEFRVALGADGAGTVEALGGPLDVRPAKGPEARLPAGTGLVLPAGQAPASPRPLLAAPNVWGGLRLVPQLPFDLDFSPLTGSRGYRVALHSARDRRGQVFEALASAPAARLREVANGDYFVRVRAIDHDGLQGLDAVALLRISVRGGPPRLASPQDASLVHGDRVTFFWRPKDDAEGYVLEIARDAAFRNIVTRTPQLADPRHLAEGLPPGEYFWRVAARMPDGQLGLFSEGRRFSLRAGAPALAPPQVDAASMRFQWAVNPGQRFELQVAADRDFRLVVAERTVDRTPVAFPLPAPGTYFARVRLLEPEGPGPYAEPVRFTVAAPPAHPPCLVEGLNGVCAVYAPAGARPARPAGARD